MNNYNFDGKVAVVFPAAMGMGGATAEAFAKNKARVVLADYDFESLQKRVDKIKAAGGEAVGLKCDVNIESDIKGVIDFAVNKYGKLDYAVNTRGTVIEFVETIEESVEAFDKMISNNIRSIYLGMKYEIPEIIKTHGAIVNIGSVGSIIANCNLGTYSGTKHAVIGMTKSAAIENAQRGIRINCVLPAVVLTEGHQGGIDRFGEAFSENYIKDVPMYRYITMEEVANTIMFLCSDDASGITGHALPVDGGQLVRA